MAVHNIQQLRIQLLGFWIEHQLPVDIPVLVRQTAKHLSHNDRAGEFEPYRRIVRDPDDLVRDANVQLYINTNHFLQSRGMSSSSPAALSVSGSGLLVSISQPMPR